MNRRTLETMKVYYSTFDAGSWVQAPRDGVLDLVDSLEAAWKELDEVRTIKNNLLQQNTELLEDIQALRREQQP